MTKRNLLLVSLFLVFGLVAMATSAVAQTSWRIGWTENMAGRHEGLAEFAGPVSIEQLGGGTIKANSTFEVDYNVPVVDLNSVYLSCSSTVDGLPYPFVPARCDTLGYGTLSAAFADATHKRLLVRFVADTVFPAANVATSIINVTARVNASLLTCPFDVTASGLSHSSSTTYSITIENPNITNSIMKVNCEPALSLGLGATRGGKQSLAAEVLTCIGVKDIGPYNNSFCLNVNEEFPNALTTSSYENYQDPDGPSVITGGTDINIALTNVPQGMGIAAKDPTSCSSLDTADPNYCLNGTLMVDDAVCTSTPDTGTPLTHTVNCDYNVISMDNGTGQKESVNLCFKFWHHGPLPPGSPQMMANVFKTPTLPQTTPPTYPIFTGELEGPSPGMPWNISVVEFSDCVTNLLFPYINTFGGGVGPAFSNFGTGIDFANTTRDPFGLNPATAKGSAVPQSGSCTVYFYPADESAMTVYTTPVLTDGGSFAFDVASATSKLTPPFGGKTGYAIAICDFQNAYGFAEIYDNYGLGDPTATLAYLAYILPDPAFYHRTPAGDLLGEEAIAPINLSRDLQKLLLYGTSGCCH